jgi:hypothetical protein
MAAVRPPNRPEPEADCTRPRTGMLLAERRPWATRQSPFAGVVASTRQREGHRRRYHHPAAVAVATRQPEGRRRKAPRHSIREVAGVAVPGKPAAEGEAASSRPGSRLDLRSTWVLPEAPRNSRTRCSPDSLPSIRCGARRRMNCRRRGRATRVRSRRCNTGRPGSSSATLPVAIEKRITAYLDGIAGLQHRFVHRPSLE